MCVFSCNKNKLIPEYQNVSLIVSKSAACRYLNHLVTGITTEIFSYTAAEYLITPDSYSH